MGSYAAPNDMQVTFSDRMAVLKRGPSVISPGHLENASSPLHAFNTKTLAEATAALKILHELSDRNQKRRLLSRCQNVEVFGETS